MSICDQFRVCFLNNLYSDEVCTGTKLPENTTEQKEHHIFATAINNALGLNVNFWSDQNFQVLFLRSKSR